MKSSCKPVELLKNLPSPISKRDEKSAFKKVLLPFLPPSQKNAMMLSKIYKQVPGQRERKTLV